MIIERCSIPDNFFEVSDYDRYKRELKHVYVKQNDSSYIRERMCHLKAGNVFKLIEKGKDLNEKIYRAISDAIYDKKSDEVFIEAVLMEDYIEETSFTN